MGDEIVIVGDDGTEHVFPAGMDPKKAAAIVRGDVVDRVTDALPMVGGTVGGLIGGLGGTAFGMGFGGIPGAAGGAALGGGAGEAAKQLLNRARGRQAPASAGEAALDIAQEGGTQAAYDVAGGLAGKAIAGLGKGLYRFALRPTKPLRQQFPGVLETAMREGLLVTKGGAETAAARMAGSRATADALITSAEKAGVGSIPAAEVLRPFRKVMQTARNAAALGKQSDVPAVVDRARRFVQGHRSGIPPTTLQTLKRTAQDSANAAYRARERGAVINSIESLMDEAQARGAREALERRVPGLAAQNTTTRELIGLTQALDEGAGRNFILDRVVGASGGAVGGLVAGGGGALPAIAGAAAGPVLVNPAVTSALGLLLHRAGAPVARGGPTLARLLALQEQLSR